MRTLPHIRFLLLLTLFVSALSSCSNDKTVNQRNTTSIASFNAAEEADVPEPIVMRQFRGCKAHR